MTYNVNQQAYGPANGTTPTLGIHFDTRDPTPNDVTYPIGKFWQNTADETMWFLNNFNSSSGIVVANWIEFSSTPTMLEDLEGNSGGPVPPNGSAIINVVGDTTTVNVVGTPLTNTLTISTAGTVATTYTEDTGTATPSAKNLNIKGTSAQGIVTSGSGSTVTITADNATAVQKGVASFNSSQFTVTAGAVASNPITVTPTGIITVSGSPVNLGGTVTIGSSIPTYTTGTFTPALAFGGSSTGITYASQMGKYVVIGNVVFVTLNIVLTSKGAQTGAATVTGLPRTSANDGIAANLELVVDSIVLSIGSGYYGFFAELAPNAAILGLFMDGNSVTPAVLTDSNFANNSQFTVQGFYQV